MVNGKLVKMLLLLSLVRHLVPHSFFMTTTDDDHQFIPDENWTSIIFSSEKGAQKEH